MASSRLIQNLIARYKLDCNAQDSTLTANHGTWTGTEAWEQLSNGSFAATFDGTKQINLTQTSSQVFTNKNSWSIQFKAKATTIGAAQYANRIINLLKAPLSVAIVVCFDQTNKLNLYYRSTGGSLVTVVISNAAVTNKEYVVTITRDSTNFKTYLNGNLVTTAPVADWFGFGAYNIEFGGSTGSYLSGALNDVRFYNVALTAAEARELYTESKQRVKTILPLPTALWKLDGTGTDVISGLDGVWTGTEAYERMQSGIYGATLNGSSYIVADAILTAMLSRNNDFTFCFKFIPKLFPATTYLVSSTYSLSDGWTLGLHSGELRFSVYNGATHYIKKSIPITNKLNQEIFICVIKSGSSASLYVNTTEATGANSSFFGNTVRTVFGARTDAAVPLTGAMSYIQIWNSAFSDAQAAELYVRSKNPVIN